VYIGIAFSFQRFARDLHVWAVKKKIEADFLMEANFLEGGEIELSEKTNRRAGANKTPLKLKQQLAIGNHPRALRRWRFWEGRPQRLAMGSPLISTELAQAPLL